MKINLAIGAPSLTGKGAHEEAVATVNGMEFPCSLHVVNHMPRAAVFPESGIELASSYASSGHVAEVNFASAAVLQRLLRTASEVAELNGYPLALTITDEAPLSITDEELTQQIVEQAPELKEEVEAAGGADAAATLADTGDGEQTNTNEAPNGEGEQPPADVADTNTTSDGEGAGGEASETGDKPAPVVEQAAAPKAGGKTKKSK